MSLYTFVRQGLEQGVEIGAVLAAAARRSRALGLWSRSRSIEEVRHSKSLLAHVGEKGVAITFQREDHGRPFDCVYFIPVEGRPLYASVDGGDDEAPAELLAFFGKRDEHGGGWCDHVPVYRTLEDACVSMIARNR